MAETLRAGSAAEAGLSDSVLRNIKVRGREWASIATVQTLVLLVARRGIVALFEPWGRLAQDASAPDAPKDAIFRIASITKVLTATAVMQLVEDGTVGLNRPVSSYIPEFQGAQKEEVLVRHLLTHTSGLSDQAVETFGKAAEAAGEVSRAEPGLHPWVSAYFAHRYGAPLSRAPGVEMEYADFNMELAGEIVRRASGKPLDEFARDRIFRPLGMKDTHYCRPDADARRRVATPLRPGETPGEFVKLVESERVCIGSGLALSTAFDMAIFVQTFLNGGTYDGQRILGPATVEAMTRNQTPGIAATFLGQAIPEASWGLGWSVHGKKIAGSGSLYSADSFEHWGAGGTYLWGDRQRDIVGVYFSAVPWDPDHPARSVGLWFADHYVDMVSAAAISP